MKVKWMGWAVKCLGVEGLRKGGHRLVPTGSHSRSVALHMPVLRPCFGLAFRRLKGV